MLFCGSVRHITAPTGGHLFAVFSAIVALPSPPISVRIIIVRSFVLVGNYYDLG